MGQPIVDVGDGVGDRQQRGEYACVRRDPQKAEQRRLGQTHAGGAIDSSFPPLPGTLMVRKARNDGVQQQVDLGMITTRVGLVEDRLVVHLVHQPVEAGWIEPWAYG